MSSNGFARCCSTRCCSTRLHGRRYTRKGPERGGSCSHKVLATSRRGSCSPPRQKYATDRTVTPYLNRVWRCADHRNERCSGGRAALLPSEPRSPAAGRRSWAASRPAIEHMNDRVSRLSRSVSWSESTRGTSQRVPAAGGKKEERQAVLAALSPPPRTGVVEQVVAKAAARSSASTEASAGRLAHGARPTLAIRP